MKVTPISRLKRLKRTALLAGVGAVVAGASLLGTAQAHAALGTDLGAVALTPGSGPTAGAAITYQTTNACPAAAQGSAVLRLVDPATQGFSNISVVNNAVAAPFGGTLTASALSNEQLVYPDLAGATVELAVFCFPGASAQGTAVVFQDTYITYSADGTSYVETNTPPTGPINTTTTLVASSPAYVGQNVTLTATVAGGSPATGTVTFENGSTVIGSGPATLANGQATVITQFAAAGAESLSAVYAPTAGTEFQPSTGTLNLSVTTPPANSGSIPLAVTVPTTGTFTLTVDTSDTVNLTVAGLTGTGATTAIGVSDTRNTYPGWSVSGQDGAWTGSGTAAGGTFSGNQLGWVPTDTALAPGVALGPSITAAAPGLGAASLLASAPHGLGNGYGTSTLGANLTLLIPPTAPAGPYASGLTVSAVTSN
jgi:Bacterial Ig-like domain (group 3)